MARPPPLPRSALLSAEVQAFGLTLRVAGADPVLIAALDADWPSLRRPGAEHASWSWRAIDAHSRDLLALCEGDVPVAAFASRRNVRRLAAMTCYRIDYAEVRDDRMGENIGLLLVALAAARAVELGASAVLLGSLPQAVEFWRKFADEGAPEGWTCAPGLRPFVIPSDRVANLARLFHGASRTT